MLRSEDAGLTWTRVATPTEILPLHSFSVATDRHEPGLIIATTSDAAVPTDRRYLSADRGRTWRAATCPGDLRGVCPAFTVDNVFGAGASYAFFPSGIYRFQAAGPALDRLAISDQLPAPIGQLIDVQAGSRAGDPVYLLARGQQGHVQGLLYRNTDGGHSWQGLLRDVSLSPTAPLTTPADPVAPACCGARFFPEKGHNLGGPFLALYQRYGGLDTFGYPRTEVYTEGDHAVQFTDRFRLDRIGSQVQPAPLGRLLTAGRSFPRLAPFSSTPDRLYFPSTGHSLTGRFLDYWRHHGATVLLGAPIAEPMYEANGDGSGRTYLVQWCENGRLEYHPEQKDSRYQVQLGLVGKQALQQRGWLP